MDGLVIGHHRGQYEEKLQSDIHPRLVSSTLKKFYKKIIILHCSWFLDMMTMLIQFLLDRQRSVVIC